MDPEALPTAEAGSEGTGNSLLARFTHWMRSVEGLLLAATGVVVAAGLLINTVSGRSAETPDPLRRDGPTTSLIEPTPTSPPRTQTAPTPTVSQSVSTPSPPIVTQAPVVGPTIDAWAASADATCRRAAPDVQAALDDLNAGFVDTVTYLNMRSEIVGALVSELRQIDPPPERALEIEEHTFRWEELGRALRDAAQAWLSGDEASYSDADVRFNEAAFLGAEVARALGAHDCARLITPSE